MGRRLEAPAAEQPVCHMGISQTVILAFNGFANIFFLPSLLFLSVVSIRQVVA